jgi:hypothetical protein
MALAVAGTSDGGAIPLGLDVGDTAAETALAPLLLPPVWIRVRGGWTLISLTL